MIAFSAISVNIQFTVFSASEDSHQWERTGINFNSGGHIRIGVFVYDGGGEALIDNICLFELGYKDLGFYLEDGEYTVEAGDFEIYIGSNSLAENKTVISVKE